MRHKDRIAMDHKARIAAHHLIRAFEAEDLDVRAMWLHKFACLVHDLPTSRAAADAVRYAEAYLDAREVERQLAHLDAILEDPSEWLIDDTADESRATKTGSTP